MTDRVKERVVPGVMRYGPGDVRVEQRDAPEIALEGWTDALAGEVVPFGTHATVIEADLVRSMAGQQTGDPAKLAQTLLDSPAMSELPQRLPAGEDSFEGTIQKGQQLIGQAGAHPRLSTTLNHD